MYEEKLTKAIRKNINETVSSIGFPANIIKKAKEILESISNEKLHGEFKEFCENSGIKEDGTSGLMFGINRALCLLNGM